MNEAGAELKRAQSVQMMMLPDAPSVSGIDLACCYRACDLLGGDFYDFIHIDAWRLGIVIADVSGHGTAAALLMAAAKKALQIYGRDTSPRSAMLAVNDSLRSDIPRGMFLSAIYGVLDIRTQVLTFVSCGHNPPYLLRGGKIKSAWVENNAPVLGVMPSSQLGKHIKEISLQLLPGDLLLLYTDGVTEAFDNHDSMFGDDRLLDSLRKPHDGGAAAVLKAIQADVDAFRSGATVSDDETMLALRIIEKPRDPTPLTTAGSGSEGMPEFSTELIGRARDLADIGALLASRDSSVITVTGAAGAGKTRVAVAAAQQRAGIFPGGVFYIDLVSAKESAEVCRAVGQRLKLSDDSANLAMRIGNALQSRTSTAGAILLVLDNCEGARQAVAECIREWRARVPDLKVLCASRVALSAPGEVVHNLRPLGLPRRHTGGKHVSLMAAVAEAPSVMLFVKRAKESDPTFTLTEENAGDISRICRHLDGIPMAIELAAARVGVLSPKQILQRLDSRFELLKGSGDKTLEGALEWSLELLNPAEREALLWLSVFANGFQLEVAEGALKKSDTPAADTLRTLMQHNLMHSEDLPEIKGEKRFHLYESVRMFALKKLQADGMEYAARSAANRALLAYARKWWRLDMEGATPLAGRRCKAEMDALLEIAENDRDPERGAWAAIIIAQRLHRSGEPERVERMIKTRKAAAKPGSEEWTWLVLTEAAVKVYDAPAEVEESLAPLRADGIALYSQLMTRAVALYTLGRNDESIALLKRAVDLPGMGPLRKAAAIERLGTLYTHIGRSDEGRQCYQLALKAARDYGDTSLETVTLNNLGRLHLIKGELDQAMDVLREAVRLAQAENERSVEANCLGALGMAMHQKGQRQQAEACLMRCLRLCREIGRPHAEVAHTHTLTRIYFESGRLREAKEVALRAKNLAHEIRSVSGEALAEANLAAIHAQSSDLDGAMQAFQRSYRIFSELGDVRIANSQLRNIGELWLRMWREQGREGALQQAISALREATAQTRHHGLAPLLPAELALARALMEAGEIDEATRVLAETSADLMASSDVSTDELIEQARELEAELSDKTRGPTQRKLPGKSTGHPGKPSSGKLTAMRPRAAMNTPRPRSDASNLLPAVKPRGQMITPPPPARPGVNKPGSSSRLIPAKPGSSSKLPPTRSAPSNRQPAAQPITPPPKGPPVLRKGTAPPQKRPKGPPGQAPKRRSRGQN
ncbi:MAG: SpoIIE family protein phosphatase [Planctomycetes bacterium]|nr:SpoIIE family protein phosphatase [Planctomycetota bacterium]MCW8137097.1 SpoIIE family protein phosphatase [Planctomycetota bacterium]